MSTYIQLRRSLLRILTAKKLSSMFFNILLLHTWQVLQQVPPFQICGGQVSLMKTVLLRCQLLQDLPVVGFLFPKRVPSQILNRHRRKTLLSQYFLSRFIHAACQNTICYHFDERCPLHTAACTKNLNELNLQFLLYITSLTTLLYIDVRNIAIWTWYRMSSDHCPQSMSSFTKLTLYKHYSCCWTETANCIHLAIWN